MSERNETTDEIFKRMTELTQAQSRALRRFFEKMSDALDDFNDAMERLQEHAESVTEDDERAEPTPPLPADVYEVHDIAGTRYKIPENAKLGVVRQPDGKLMEEVSTLDALRIVAMRYDPDETTLVSRSTIQKDAPWQRLTPVK